MENTNSYSNNYNNNSNDYSLHLNSPFTNLQDQIAEIKYELNHL